MSSFFRYFSCCSGVQEETPQQPTSDLDEPLLLHSSRSGPQEPTEAEASAELAKIVKANENPLNIVGTSKVPRYILYNISRGSQIQLIRKPLLSQSRVGAYLDVLCRSRDVVYQAQAAELYAKEASPFSLAAATADDSTIRNLSLLLRSPDSGTRANALSALQQLSLSETNKKKIVQLDTLSDLLSLIRGNDIREKKSALSIVLSVSAIEENKPLLARSELVAVLVTCINQNDPALQSDAFAILTNLATYPGSHATIASMCLDDLLYRARGPDEQLAVAALILFSRLASAEPGREALAQNSDILSTLERLFLAPELATRREAAAVIALLVSSPTAARYYANRPTFIELVQASSRTSLNRGILQHIFIALLTDSPDLEERAIAAKAILFHLLSEKPPPPLSIRELEMIGRELLPFTEPIIRNYSATAINLLSQNADMRRSEQLLGFLPHMILILSSADPNTKGQLIEAFANLSAEVAFQREIGHKPQLIEILSSFLEVENPATRQLVLTTMLNLSAIEENRAALGKYLIAPLLSLTRKKDKSIRHLALSVLLRIGLCPENKIKIVQSGATEPLIHMAFLDAEIPALRNFLIGLINSENVEVQSAALNSLRNIAKNPEIGKIVCTDAEILRSVYSILPVCHPDVRWTALYCLNRFVSVSEDARTLAYVQEYGADALRVQVKEGGISVLSKVLTASTTDARSAAEILAILCVLSEKDENKEPILESGIYASLVMHLTSRNQQCQLRACTLLKSLCVNDANKLRVFERGMLEVLGTLTNSTDVDLRAEVFSTLSLLATRPEVKGRLSAMGLYNLVQRVMATGGVKSEKDVVVVL